MSDIGERVKKIVVEDLGVEADKVTENASFIDDLGADSLDTVELVMAFEVEFGCELHDDAGEMIRGVGASWRRLINAESGISRVERIDVSDLPARIAGQIPRGDGADGSYNPDEWMEPKEQRKVDEFIAFALCAAKQALEDARWQPQG